MAVFTFSTKTKNPQDTEVVLRAKQYCDTHHMYFSGLLIKLLKKFLDEVDTKGSVDE